MGLWFRFFLRVLCVSVVNSLPGKTHHGDTESTENRNSSNWATTLFSFHRHPASLDLTVEIKASDQVSVL